MFLNKIIAAAAVSLVAAAAPSLSAQSIVPPEGTFPDYLGGVGPVISGSVTTGTLPKKATEFIGKYFPQTLISDIEEEFETGTFDVDLVDGTDLEFDSKGEWTEVDAARGALADTLVKALIPDRAFKELARLQYTDKVETVKRSDRGYKVELRGTQLDDLRFDRDGKLVSIGM